MDMAEASKRLRELAAAVESSSEGYEAAVADIDRLQDENRKLRAEVAELREARQTKGE